MKDTIIKTGHLKDGHAPDKTYNDPEKADRMARATYEALLNAAEVMKQKGTLNAQMQPVAWEKLEPLVQAFTRARSAREKARIISQITQLARENARSQVIIL